MRLPISLLISLTSWLMIWPVAAPSATAGSRLRYGGIERRIAFRN